MPADAARLDATLDLHRVVAAAVANGGMNPVELKEIVTSAARPGARFDMSTPANQGKLDVVEELAQLADKSGLTMIELALAWAINHPAVTSAIIGPRTMEQLESQLSAAGVTLDTEILDRVDQLVAPGVTLNADDNSYGAAELTRQARRR